MWQTSLQLLNCDFDSSAFWLLTWTTRVKHVYGYELVPEAVADARRNADRNGILNATFIQGDLNKLTGDFGKDFPKPDIVITGRIILSS